MHDMDRTQLEFEHNEFQEMGFETGSGELEVPLTEVQELQLTSELLEVTNEQELEQFLGKLLSTAGKAARGAAGQFVRSDTGRALGGILSNAAKQAVPVVGRGIGNWIAPGRGGDIGADLATHAGNLFGLELEGLSSEDREFEVARQFVRFASAAGKAASSTPGGNPVETARAAVKAAARQYAPGLLAVAVPSAANGSVQYQRAHSGRWVRKGNSIVILGL